MVKVLIPLVLIFCSGCLTMGAKLEVEKLLNEHQAAHALEVRDIARAATEVRVAEVFKDRLPALVEAAARPIANDRSIEVLQAQIPGMVSEEFRKAGVTKKFVDETSEGVKATRDELAKTNWPAVAQTIGLALIAAYIGKKELGGKKKSDEPPKETS